MDAGDLVAPRRRGRRGCARRGSPPCPRCAPRARRGRRPRARARPRSSPARPPPSAGIAPSSSGTRRRKRRTAATSRTRPSSVSATSRRVVLVPMSTHAQRIRLPSSPAVSTSAPAILVRDLRKAYGEHEAVRGLDFEVAAGEVFGLLGPNGAGKTTTVEILEGYRDAHGRDRVGARTRSAAALAGAARAGGHRPAVDRDVPPRHAARGAGPLRPLLSAPARRRGGHRDHRPAGEGRRLRAHAVGRPAAPARPRARPHRRPRADLPRRADDGLRPGGAPQRVGGHPLAAGAGQDDPAHHALPRRGPGAVRPRGDHQGGADRGRGPAGRAGRGVDALPRGVARRARRAAGARGRRPDGAAAPAHERRPGPWRGAARPLGHAALAGGRLPRAHRRGAEEAHHG